MDPDSPFVAHRAGRMDQVEALVAYIQCGHLTALHAEDEAAAAMTDAPAAAAAAAPLTPAEHAFVLQCSAQLRSLLRLLKIPVSAPPPTALDALEKVRAALTATMASLPASVFEPLVPAGSLDAVQLEDLAEIDAALRSEYAVRRRVLIERVLVTLKSFAASPKVEGNGELAAAVARATEEGLAALTTEPTVSLSDVQVVTLADVMDVAAKATSGDRTFKSSMKGVIIGDVPDRGGRTEGKGGGAMGPQWKARSEATPAGGGGGGHMHGRGRGKGKG